MTVRTYQAVTAGYGDNSMHRAALGWNITHDATEVEVGNPGEARTVSKESIYLVFGPLDITKALSNTVASLTLTASSTVDTGNKEVRVALLKNGAWNQAGYHVGEPLLSYHINMIAYDGNGLRGTSMGIEATETIFPMHWDDLTDVHSYGQSFVHSIGGDYPFEVNYLGLAPTRVGSRPNGNLWITAWTVDAAGNPVAKVGTTDLIANDSISTIPGPAEVFTFPEGSRPTVSDAAMHLHYKIESDWTDASQSNVIYFAGAYQTTKIAASSGRMTCYTNGLVEQSAFSQVGYMTAMALPYISEFASDDLTGAHFGNVLGPVTFAQGTFEAQVIVFTDEGYHENPGGLGQSLVIPLGAEIEAWIQSDDYQLGGNDYIAITIDPYDEAAKVVYTFYASETGDDVPQLSIQYDAPDEVKTGGVVVRPRTGAWAATGRAVGSRGARTSPSVTHAGAAVDPATTIEGAKTTPAVEATMGDTKEKN